MEKKNKNEVWQGLMKMNKKTTLEQIQQLLAKHPQCTSWTSATGMDLLSTACATSNLRVADELIKLGAEVNRTDKNGKTPLHYASSVGCMPIFELLVQKGAVLDAKTRGG